MKLLSIFRVSKKPEVSFIPLKQKHFSLLLKWLEEPHVKRWWDRDIVYNMALVKKKYLPRLGSNKIFCYIIAINNQPMSYIQFYNAYDFPRKPALKEFPKSLASLDFFIGDSSFLDKGLGSVILSKFLKDQVFAKFDYCFVDPNINNQPAIRSYEKSGFKEIKRTKNNVLMMAENYINLNKPQLKYLPGNIISRNNLKNLTAFNNKITKHT